jgi:outer membrane lipoprotein-sorting protein
MRFAILLGLLFAAAAQASSIDRFKSFVRTTQSARGNFEQKVHDRAGTLVQESKGSFVFLCGRGAFAGSTRSRSIN